MRELYTVPVLSLSQKGFFFQLNANEEQALKNLKSLHAKVYFIYLLGHFNNKPITLGFTIYEAQDEINHILNLNT